MKLNSLLLSHLLASVCYWSSFNCHVLASVIFFLHNLTSEMATEVTAQQHECLSNDLLEKKWEKKYLTTSQIILISGNKSWFLKKWRIFINFLIYVVTQVYFFISEIFFSFSLYFLFLFFFPYPILAMTTKGFWKNGQGSEQSLLLQVIVEISRVFRPPLLKLSFVAFMVLRNVYGWQSFLYGSILQALADTAENDRMSDW